MRSFLLQPYPFTENTSRKLALCAGIGLFVALFLGVFRPFGFDGLRTATAWMHAFYFGSVTFVVSSFFQILLPLLFPRPFAEEGWRSWKEIVYLLVTTAAIGAGNFLLNIRLYPQGASFQIFLWSELTTLEVGVFPVLFIVFMKQLRLYSRFTTEAREVVEDIQGPGREATGFELSAPAPQRGDDALLPGGRMASSVSAESIPSVQLVLRGDNQKEELALLPHNLLAVASADNYVNVHYFENGRTTSTLLRGSLKKFEEQLAGHDAFFRCHRMYIVNLQAVTDVSGNAQGLKLHLTGLEESVPVSRNLTETVKEKLHTLSRSSQNA